MPRFVFLTLFRSLMRHRLHSALNIGGLAVGIAVFLVLGLYVRFETSFERWLPEHGKVYVVETVWNLPGNPDNGAYPYTMGGLLDQIRGDFPGVVGTRIRGGADGGTVFHGGIATTEDVAEVDRNFFEVFGLPMLQGDGRSALAQPDGAVISESTARKYFAGVDPIGRTMRIAFDDLGSYRVAGVFRDLPRNSDLKLSILIPIPRNAPVPNWFHWGSTTLATYLRFDTPDAARAFEQTMPSFVARHGSGIADLGPDAAKELGLKLLPLASLHLQPQGSAVASEKITVVSLGLVGLATLLIAIVNYVNLATARAGLRAREVAMRKVLGASRGALVVQFLGEAMLTVAIAAVGGAALAELGLPIVNAAGGIMLAIPYALALPALLGLILLVGTLGGVYPAFLLSRFPAAEVLASARNPGGGRTGARVREALVVLQFGLAIAFMIGTAVLVAQTVHVRRTDLGFRREGLVVVRSLADATIPPDRKRAYAAAVQDLPGVRGMALGNGAVGGSGEDNSDSVKLPGVSGPGPSLKWIVTGPGFFSVYGAHVLAGRVFDDVHRADDPHGALEGQATNIVINRRAVEILGFASPAEAVGRTVGGDRPRTIIGVIDDMRFGSPRDANPAAYYVYDRSPEDQTTVVASVRYSGDPHAVLARLRALWTRTVPQVPFDAQTADQRLAEYYRADDRAMRLFAIGAGLAVLIGCVGLWGLASFGTARRTREIGIRKVLGASSATIVRLLVGQFLRPVLIANLVAWPLAFIAMRSWLAGFDDRIALSPFYFIGATLLALLIAVATVLAQSLRAARATPGWALRHD